MIGRAVMAALLALGVVPEEPLDWRHVATFDDRGRLHDWRTAWIEALADARSGDGHGAGAAAIAGDPALFDPDGALLDRALPPAGEYRCRRYMIGVRTIGAPFAAGDWGRCRVEGEATPRLVSLDGVQRFIGTIYPDGVRRAIFLGTAIFPDEHRPAVYGHAAGRDMAGVVERVGERRWRLELPYPHFGAKLDLIELVPAA